MKVLIAGGGIGGLTLALTCHQLGIPFKVFEQVGALKPLGVGINLQPVAVRELYDLGLEEKVEQVGIRTRDFGLYTSKGLHVWTESRGEWAGYAWPQYSIHRGHLHMLLYDTLIDRAGAECIATAMSAVGFENTSDGIALHLQSANGEDFLENGSVLVGADGIHSSIRRQMNPEEGDPVWGGSVLWRATSQAEPFLSGASMVLIGPRDLRFVAYPISAPDSDSGLATINWIAEQKFTPEDRWNKEDWSREANKEDLLPRFEDFRFEWLNVPDLIRKAGTVFEYPMVDRDPLKRWTVGNATLLGDAAHPAYPVGSNGAGSAILDARKLGHFFLKHGVNAEALAAYEAEMRPVTSNVTLANRKAGPDSIIDIVEKKCTGGETDVEEVVSQQELQDHAGKYKALAGVSVSMTNEAPQTVAAGVKIQM